MLSEIKQNRCSYSRIFNLPNLVRVDNSDWFQLWADQKRGRGPVLGGPKSAILGQIGPSVDRFF